MNFDSFLDSMPEDELKRLHAKIANRLGSDSTITKEVKPNSGSDQLGLVYEAFSQILSSKGFRTIPWNRFQESRDLSAFTTKGEWLISYARKNFKPETRIQLSYTLILLTKLLTEWLEKINVPLSYRTLINNLDRIPSLVDESFPGYGKAGLLPAVVKNARR